MMVSKKALSPCCAVCILKLFNLSYFFICTKFELFITDLFCIHCYSRRAFKCLFIYLFTSVRKLIYSLCNLYARGADLLLLFIAAGLFIYHFTESARRHLFYIYHDRLSDKIIIIAGRGRIDLY
jgi:hypothetical protein